MNAPAVNPQLLRLSTLIDLERRARAARGVELTYLIVNDTIAVVPYQQAALWRAGQLAAVSGVAKPEPGGPYAVWLDRVMNDAARASEQAMRAPAADQDAATPVLLPETAMAKDGAAFFPPNALWVPLPDPRGGLAGGLLLGRADPWHPAELQLLAAIGGTYGLALAAGELPRRRVHHRHRHLLLRYGIAALVIAASFVPVRSSVLAPAEIVAAAPYPVRAPFDGVVDAIHVTPNATVHKGDRLLSLETTERRAKVEVAAKALDAARAEYAEASQQALTDPRAKGRLATLQSKIAQAQLEYDYGRAMLVRADVPAPIDGVAVFEDAHQWIGRPVTIGERIMVMAPPRSAALDIAVAVNDVVTFAPGAEVVFFPNITPDQPAHGTLESAGYGAAPQPDGVLAYLFRAQLTDTPDGLRLGLKGTAKIYGPSRPFILWVLRRPLAAVREWLTL